MRFFRKKPKFGAGIHILVKKDNKFLLLRRSPKDLDDPNCWDLPGGGIRYLEKPLDAALREAREEAGIKVKIIKILDMWGKLYQNNWSMESLVEAEYLRGEVKLSLEHLEHKWVTKQELKEIEPKSQNLKALFNINESLTHALTF